MYGLLKLESVEHIFKRYFLIKAILCYEKRIKTLIDEDFSDLINSKIVASKPVSKSASSEDISEGDTQVAVKKEDDHEEDLASLERKKTKYTQVAKLYLSLGHFYLLIYDYAKALECYQKFYKFKLHKLQVSFDEFFV